MPPDHLLKYLPEHTSLECHEAITGLDLWLLDVDSNLELDAAGIQSWWSAMPYWAFAWAGGRALAAWILDNPSSVAGKVVMDFGCGSGIVAIAAAQAGAKASWAVDIDPMALRAVQANAELNRVVVQTSSDWTAVQADCFFSSDVLYDPDSHRTLKTLCDRMHHGWIAEPVEAMHLAIDQQKVYPGIPVRTSNSATLPAIGDFDQSVHIEILPVSH